MNNTLNVQSPATPTLASIKVAELGVPVTVTTSETRAPGKTVAAKVAVDYAPKVSVELAESDDQSVVAKTRPEYVVAFKAGVEKTARATLEMCRVVYEAHKSLDDYEFGNFCPLSFNTFDGCSGIYIGCSTVNSCGIILLRSDNDKVPRYRHCSPKVISRLSIARSELCFLEKCLICTVVLVDSCRTNSIVVFLNTNNNCTPIDSHTEKDMEPKKSEKIYVRNYCVKILFSKTCHEDGSPCPEKRSLVNITVWRYYCI
jgi:hypothetical protein